MLKIVNLQNPLVIVLVILILVIGVAFFIYSQVQKKLTEPKPSNYELCRNAQINQPSYYPINQTLSSSLYQPVSEWIGRLIQPPKNERTTDDSVLFEVYHAAPEYQHLVGQIVTLGWSKDAPGIQDYVKRVTTDINFNQATINSMTGGTIHPVRLNHLNRVGPLESLAGARPDDNVIVMVNNPVVTESETRTSLSIVEDPVQITGRFYGLVTIIKREAQESDRFQVSHFNKDSKQFDGPQEIIRIPQVVADRDGIPRSTNSQIEDSPLNSAGWYIYGAQDPDGIFVTQGIEPRALMMLEPDQVILGVEEGVTYIKEKNWENTEQQKSTAKTVLLDPLAEQPEAAISRWQEGDRGIVIHLFGGIGGNKKDERAIFNMVTGHFAYGIAHVVRDPLSDELRFDIEYDQVYASNPDGIVSGSIKWPNYMGNLQRGWLGDRPVSDVIVKLDAVTQDYEFGDIKLSPLDEFKHQLQVMMARYRTGDGDGAALVSPAESCVQDSNQALYVAIQQIEDEVNANPDIQEWLKSHRDHPQTQRFQQLSELGQALEKQLTPLGIVRSDWKENAETLVGVATSDNPIIPILRGLASWRTILPRGGHDEIASLLLNHGAKLWVIRTNQVGGFDPDIIPYAPTTFF
ncbi:abortive infection protein [Moorena sp. SIO4G3]|uniref:abortive infection protein n=1 Tax=Moorena sp. SIO4G3 TaxID=2607821 RepID=UPI0025F83C10|nr:abortive infection protein [Moorena sp. SIO4G3]